MALTPTITSPQARVIAVAGGAPAGSINVPQARVIAIANVPAERIDATQARVLAVGRQPSQIRVPQARVIAVVRGAIYNPKLRAWRFRLDGHYNYVLRLGDGKTLVYDLATGQWAWWSHGAYADWRITTGLNWTSSAGIAKHYGSNVVCGDSVHGHLWVLDPEKGFDDARSSPPGDPERFPREATGQVITRQRKFLPVYEVYLTASGGEPVLTGDEVVLEFSDDVGRTFVSAGPIAVNEGDYRQEFAWRSLGQIGAPGRLFRVTDDGAFARIDGLDCSIGGG